jgi:hypothetical protein
MESTLLVWYDQNASLGQAFGKLGHCADHLSNLYKMKTGRESVMFLEPVKEYMRLLDAVKVWLFLGVGFWWNMVCVPFWISNRVSHSLIAQNMMQTRKEVSDRYKSAMVTLEAKQARANATAASPDASIAAQELKEVYM